MISFLFHLLVEFGERLEHRKAQREAFDGGSNILLNFPCLELRFASQNTEVLVLLLLKCTYMEFFHFLRIYIKLNSP